MVAQRLKHRNMLGVCVSERFDLSKNAVLRCFGAKQLKLKLLHAKVAELADAPDLGSGSRKAMGVRLPPFAPIPFTLNGFPPAADTLHEDGIC